jgi:hypothetical protein
MDGNELVNALAQLLTPHLSERQKHDLPAGFSISTNRVHGSNGIFSYPGIERDIFSTRVNAKGLIAALPAARATNDTHPIVGYLTGFTAGNGAAEQSTPCADPPRPGQMKSCLQGSAMGRIARTTEVIDLSASGDRINRGEMFDLQLVNDPIVDVAEKMLPPGITGGARKVFASDLAAKMLAVGVELEDVLSHMVWTGSPLNNLGTGYAEFLGLEGLVTTTHTDIITGANCPSLASDIKDFGSQRVDQAAATLFHYMTTMWRYVNHNASRMNMRPVQWAWVMTEPMFRELTDYWPCVYASYRCGATANQLANNTDAMAMRRMSDDMFNGNYLTIDGVRIPVIVDDSISVTYNENDGDVPSGCMLSDIYLLPFTVKGNTQVLYMEYFNFAGPGAAGELAADGRVSNLIWSDGGMWLWTPRQTLYCFDWTTLIRPRLRLLTPHLAGRIQNVMVCPLQIPRQPFHDDPYFVDGGNTTVSQGTPYSYASVDVRAQ